MTDARKLLITRAIRGLADGVVSVALATYLTGLGSARSQVGAIVTATLLGSAAVTLGVGLARYRLPRRRVLLGAAALMLRPGSASPALTAFWPLMIVAFAGTLNPSSGDVSLFLPTEQAALAHTASGPEPHAGLRLVQPGRVAGRRRGRAAERRARAARGAPRA